MFPLFSLLLFIFVTYPKEKMKENYYYFILKNLGTPGVRMQKYPKSTSTQKVSGTSTVPFLEYMCFIEYKLLSLSFDTNFEGLNASYYIDVAISLKSILVSMWRFLYFIFLS